MGRVCRGGEDRLYIIRVRFMGFREVLLGLVGLIWWIWEGIEEGGR